MTSLPDLRDAVEREAVAALLSALLAEHAARVAFAHGADTIALTHLVGDMLLAEQLKEAWLASYRRMVERASGRFRPT